MGIPGDIDALGEAMSYDLRLRHPGEWSAARGMDSPSTRHPTGLSSSPITLYPSSGCLGGMHNASVLAQSPIWFPVGQHSRWHTLAAMCKRYDILHPGIHGGGTDTLDHDGNLLGFLGCQTEPGQVQLCGVRFTRRGDG